MAVTGNVGEEHAADAAGGAARNVVDIPAARGLAVRLAVHPQIEAAQLHSAGGKLAAAPNLHALHVLHGRIRHGGIITVDKELNRFDLLVKFICHDKYVIAR